MGTEEYEDFVTEISGDLSKRVEKIDKPIPTLAAKFLNPEKVIREWPEVKDRIIEDMHGEPK